MFTIRARGISDVTVSVQSEELTNLQVTVFDSQGREVNPSVISGGDHTGFVFLHEDLTRGLTGPANEQQVDLFVEVSAMYRRNADGK